MNVQIELLQEKDWEAVRNIHSEGMATGNATFETEVPDWETWHAHHLPFCRLVARHDQDVVGWCALSPVSARPVYSGVAEVSIYITQSARSQGVGKALMTRLIKESEKNGIWTLQAGLFPENMASRILHRSQGFREVGVRERLGTMNGIWRDVILMERRSEKR